MRNIYLKTGLYRIRRSCINFGHGKMTRAMAIKFNHLKKVK